jgi:DNA-directed RNA polymerase subunit F
MISCFFPCVFTKLKKDVDKRAKYDVEDLDVKEAVKKLDPDTVVVFLSGENDQLINPRNSKKLYDICPCTEKHIKIFDGDHNSKRPEHVMNEVMGIIQKFVFKR